MALKSAICLYDTYIGCDTPILEYIPLHKLGQDHLELFFGNLRDHGGHNDNPTARQFTAAYKKLLIHSEIKNNGVGNCIPLEDINILNCSSGKKVSAADLINERNIIYNERSNCSTICKALEDHDYLFSCTLSKYVQNIVVYIAGFVAKKLLMKIKCEICLTQLLGENDNLLNSFINFKSRGRLTYPSDNVITVCKETEKIIQHYRILDDLIDNAIKYKICNEALKKFLFSKIFDDMNRLHSSDENIFYNHRILLIKAIIEEYASLRLYYIAKQLSAKDSIRNHFKKIILFKGQ